MELSNNGNKEEKQIHTRPSHETPLARLPRAHCTNVPNAHERMLSLQRSNYELEMCFPSNNKAQRTKDLGSGYKKNPCACLLALKFIKVWPLKNQAALFRL